VSIHLPAVPHSPKRFASGSLQRQCQGDGKALSVPDAPFILTCPYPYRSDALRNYEVLFYDSQPKTSCLSRCFLACAL
jgi:hypothetical protein